MPEDIVDSADYFRKREEELIRLNAKLEEQKLRVLQNADAAIRATEESQKRTPFTPLIPSNTPDPVIPAEPATLPGVTIGASLSHLENLQNTVRYQKARVSALQDELDRVSRVNRDRDAEMHAIRQELKAVQEENKKWFKKATTADTDIDKIAKKATNTESAIDQAALKKAEAESKSKEVKLNRLMEENDRLKASVRDLKSSERDKVNVEKEVCDKLNADVKRLTKQRNELINLVKKQIKLVDILRRQKTHLEAARMLNFTEDEFVTALKLDEKVNQ
jgi:hypothetical protein